MLIGLLKTIIFLMVVYYISKFVIRIWLKNKIADTMKQQQNSMDENEAAYKKQEKGKVTIKKDNSATGSSSSASGDYVDYEEVKE